jgi:dolichol kinase
VRRKLIHLCFIVLPLWLLHPLGLLAARPRRFPHAAHRAGGGRVAVDLLRLHAPGVRQFFRRFFGEMIREHEELSLLGSTYLLLAALLAIEIFPQPVAAAALASRCWATPFAAVAGKAWGRTRLFHKTLEGRARGLRRLPASGRRTSASAATCRGRRCCVERWPQV